MKQKIIGFDQDEIGDWRAILACGHRQHVRHNPPLGRLESIIAIKAYNLLC